MQYHLAQINIARMLGENINHPVMKAFVEQLDAMNALAESSNGFVWRLKSGEGNATEFNPYNDERIIVNFSVWQSAEHLRAYTYQSAHTEVMRNRRSWFEKFGKPYYALWYVERGYIPTVQQAVERLEYLQQHGASNYAFDFSNIFPPPGSRSL